MAFFPHIHPLQNLPLKSLSVSFISTSNLKHTHYLREREKDYALCISRGRFRRLENNYMTEVRFLCRQLATFGSFAKV